MLATFATSPLRSYAAATNFLHATGMPNISNIGSGLFMAASVFAALISPALSAKNRFCNNNTGDQDQQNAAVNEDKKVLGASISGAMFAAGLCISGMVKTSKVHDFLCLSGFSRGSYDPTLMTVMGSAILASWLAYQFVDGSWSSVLPKERTLSCPAGLSDGACFSVPTNTVIDGQLLTGAATFGIGWGLTGVCPGPALFAAASGNMNAIVLWMPAFVVGSMAGSKIKELWKNTKKKSA